MDMSVAWIAAGASIIGAVLGTGATFWLGLSTMRRQYMLEHQSEALARKLLENPKWRLRTFKTIKYHLAGFEDNELRRVLIRAGALRFEDQYGIEVWGLLERNKELVEKEYGTLEN